MSLPITITRDDRPTSGRYVVQLPDGLEAEMTFRKLDARTIAIDHTGVPRQYRNAGIALKLVEAGIADARRDGIKIVAECSYVQAQFRRHPEWADLEA